MAEISIIVPVYKAEEYLRDCVDSILSQTFPDFELILVDDGSPDNCGAICDQYALRDRRVRVIHQQNQGQAAARNHALSQAEGNWICFADSDDLIHPQLLELLHNAAMEGNAPISLCGAVEAAELPLDFFQNYGSCFEAFPITEASLGQLLDMDAYACWVIWGKLIRKDIIEKHPFCPGRIYEDNEAVCHWLYEAKTVAKVPYPLYFYRVNAQGTTKSSFSLKKLDYLWALEQIIRFYGSVGYTQMRSRFIDIYVGAVAGSYQGAKYTLESRDAAEKIEREAYRFLRREHVHLTKAQFEILLDAMHPRLIRFYWPVEAGFRTLREHGISGFMEKVMAQLRKGRDK